MNADMNIQKLARKFVRSWDAGILSTNYEVEGEKFPFGSVCPYVTTESGEIIVLISDIAVHTKNIKQDAHVGFTVFDLKANNKQAASRVSLVGKATVVLESDEKRYAEVSERYFLFFPEAKHYFKAHNFNFYTMKPVNVHYVKTFGQIFNFDGKAWEVATPEWKGSETMAITHMNKDHKYNLVDYAKKFLGLETENVRLMAVDGEGFHMEVEKDVHYVSFVGEAFDKEGLRREFVALAKNETPKASVETPAHP